MSTTVTGWGTATALDAAVGLVVLALGLLCCRRPADRRAGALVAAVGATWLFGDVTSAATFLHRGPLVHVLLGYPTGRLRSRPARALVLASYVVAAVPALARVDALTVLLATGVLATAVRNVAVTSGPVRRAHAAGLAATVLAMAAFCIGPVTRWLGVDSQQAVLATYDGLILAAVLVLVADLVRGRWAQDMMTGLVLELGDSAGTTGLRDRLARAVGDPTLVVAYWLPDESRYVDEDGRPIDAEAPPGDDRVVTPVSLDGRPVALLVHDAHVLADPALLADVAAAAGLAVRNARLQAEVRTQVAGVQASRRRLVTAADEERRLLEERLRHGAQHRLATVQQLLSTAGSPLDRLTPDVERAATTLRQLGMGIHPAALASGELADALRGLAVGAAVPVVVDADDSHVDPAAATAAYFVCAEALTNIAKYAGATSAQVRLHVTPSSLELTVEDDGIGGADPSVGSGLRGLADRAEALGGHVSVTSPPGHGTHLALRLPVATSTEVVS